MKRVAAVLLMGVFSSSYAFGATVTFDAQGSTDLHPDPDKGPTIGTWVVSVSDSVDFGAIVAVIGVDSLNQTPGPDVSFSADSAFAALFTLFDVADPGPGVYDSDIMIEGVSFTGLIGLPQVAGTLTVDATGAKPGEYLIVIDGNSDADDGRSGLADAGQNIDPLVGSTSFTVLPEPATLTLLGLAALGLIRRRKSA